MEETLGVLKVNIMRGINLAIRDTTTSDPYAVLALGQQKVKTKVVKNDCNPIWNENFTFAIKDPNVPIHLTVYDKDTFTGDDEMGEGDIDIKPYLEAHQMGLQLQKLPNGCALKRVQPGKNNCLADESSIVLANGKITQEMTLRLKNVECGEVQVMIEWAESPRSKNLGHEDSKKSPFRPTKRRDMDVFPS